MSIYKPYDIRGRAERELTPELYRRWGRALGARVEPAAKFVVGGDVRGSTPRFLSALIQGFCESGVHVVDLGQLPTPMVHHAQRRLRAAGCAIVTGSHGPAELNGLKWNLDGRPPTEQEMAWLQQEAEIEPTGGVSPDSDSSESAPAGIEPGTARPLDVSFDYVAWLQETWARDAPVRLRIVVDPMHGCLGHRARRYLQAVFPMALVWVVRDDPKPDFAGIVPDCARSEHLEALAQAVDHARADLGIAWDADGGRVAFVDDTSTILTAEETTSILLESLGEKIEGQTFVHDVKFSDCVAKRARDLGADDVVERSGHAFIHRRMLDTGAVFGAGVRGHYFFGELDGNGDGLFAACRMIDHLADARCPLSELRRACAPVFITPDLRVPLEPSLQAAVMEHVRASWSEYPHTLVDGVRIDFPNGWALARGSVTEAAMTFRFEAADWTELDKLVWQFSEGLPHVGEALWATNIEHHG